MNAEPGSEAVDVEALRRKHYNASLVELREVHASLRIFRVQVDDQTVPFTPGQYTTLGLGAWEVSVARQPAPQSQQAPDDQPATTLIRRAYSFSSPMLDANGQLVDAGNEEQLEFYVVLTAPDSGHRPGLTPRLFALSVGDRLHVGLRPKGTYTLAPVAPDDDVVFAATGTGEAPHNAMIAHLLKAGHRGRILSVVGVRRRTDLAYEAVHRELERRYSQYRYVPLTSREPCNLDAGRSDFVGKEYVQQFLGSPRWDELWGEIRPDRTHVFACGNPAMIGIPQTDDDGSRIYPEPTGLIESLEARGFRADAPRQPGNIHFEKFW